MDIRGVKEPQGGDNYAVRGFIISPFAKNHQNDERKG
jgi:hypothetical protein